MCTKFTIQDIGYKRKMASIIEDTQEFVRSALEGNDASHDYAHRARLQYRHEHSAAREGW